MLHLFLLLFSAFFSLAMRQKPRPVRSSRPLEEPAEADAASGPNPTLESLVTSVAAVLAELQSQIEAMTQRQRLVGRDCGLLVKLMSPENQRRVGLTRRARQIVRRSRWRCRSAKQAAESS